MTPAIRIAGVTKRFRSLQALAGVDLEVAQGEFFGPAPTAPARPP